MYISLYHICHFVFNELYSCGAAIEDIPGKPHSYLGAPQGCFNVYMQVLGKEFGEYGYPELTHRLTVDTYSVQHPGIPERRSIQSVNIHLIGLYCILVKELSATQATIKMRSLLRDTSHFTWLEPPEPNGQITIVDALKAQNLSEHEKIVRAWAESVWESWYSKHTDTIERLMRDDA